MTREDVLQKSREITAGTNCFVLPVGGTYKVCRRVQGRVIYLGYRTDGAQLVSWLRKLTSH